MENESIKRFSNIRIERQMSRIPIRAPIPIILNSILMFLSSCKTLSLLVQNWSKPLHKFHQNVISRFQNRRKFIRVIWVPLSLISSLDHMIWFVLQKASSSNCIWPDLELWPWQKKPCYFSFGSEQKIRCREVNNFLRRLKFYNKFFLSFSIFGPGIIIFNP